MGGTDMRYVWKGKSMLTPLVANMGQFDRRFIIFGSADGETLNGGAQSDRLYGMSGDDTLNGGGAIDHLEGGAGIDTLNGGEGAAITDRITGRRGDDILIGGTGKYQMAGKAWVSGNDEYYRRAA